MLFKAEQQPPGHVVDVIIINNVVHVYFSCLLFYFNHFYISVFKSPNDAKPDEKAKDPNSRSSENDDDDDDDEDVEVEDLNSEQNEMSTGSEDVEVQRNNKDERGSDDFFPETSSRTSTTSESPFHFFTGSPSSELIR